MLFRRAGFGQKGGPEAILPMKNISDSDFDQTITLREAYQLLEAFILQYNARGERSTADLAVDVAVCPDGHTSDPAQLDVS